MEGRKWRSEVMEEVNCLCIDLFRKSKVVESQLPDELGVEEDDIIADTLSAIPHHSLFTAPQGQSQPVGKVFVERNSE